MINPQLADYVSKELAAGMRREQIRLNLIGQGWLAADVDAALAPTAAAPLVTPASSPVATAPSLSAPAGHSGMTRKKWLMIGAAVIVLALLVGGGAYAYFGYYLSTDRIMGETKARLLSVKTVQYQGNTLLNMQETDSDTTNPRRPEKPRKLDIDFSGSANTEKIDDLSSFFSINIKGNAINPDEVTSLGVDMRSIAAMMYFKVMFAADEKKSDELAMLESFNNKWYSIDLDALRKQFGAALPDELKKDSATESTAKVKEALTRHQPMIITGRLPSEKINGVTMFHYSYSFDKKELTDLLAELRGVITGDPKTDQNDIDGIRESIEKAQMPTGEIWISRKDYLPYKITFNAVNKKTIGTVTSDWNMALTLNLSKYNEAVVVEKPADATPLEEAMKGMLGAIDGTGSASGELTPTSITDGDGTKLPVGGMSNTDTDKDGIPDDIEEVLGTDPKKADTDGDGHNDKDELDNGYNPLGPGRLDDAL